MIENDIARAAARVLDLCRAKGLKVATAESCTGGLVSAALTEIAGSSDVVECGFIVYANAAKHAMLGVSEALLERDGAVSRQTAAAMAQGALSGSRADIAVSITGIAGPGGGSADKPVGLVHFAAATREGARIEREARYGDIGRRAVRLKSVLEALAMIEHVAAGAWGGASPDATRVKPG